MSCPIRCLKSFIMDSKKKHQSSLSHSRGIDHLHLEAKPGRPRRWIDDPQTLIVDAAKPTGRIIVSRIAEQLEATSAIRLDTHYKGKRKNRKVCVCPCVGISVIAGYRTSGSIVTPDETAMGDTL